jgi:hypothetical protein
MSIERDGHKYVYVPALHVMADAVEEAKEELVRASEMKRVGIITEFTACQILAATMLVKV